MKLNLMDKKTKYLKDFASNGTITIDEISK